MKRTKMEIADDLTDKELIKLLENRGYKVPRFRKLGFSIDGKRVYRHIPTDRLAIEQSVTHLRLLSEEEKAEAENKLRKKWEADSEGKNENDTS